MTFRKIESEINLELRKIAFKREIAQKQASGQSYQEALESALKSLDHSASSQKATQVTQGEKGTKPQDGLGSEEGSRAPSTQISQGEKGTKPQDGLGSGEGSRTPLTSIQNTKSSDKGSIGGSDNGTDKGKDKGRAGGSDDGFSFGVTPGKGPSGLSDKGKVEGGDLVGLYDPEILEDPKKAATWLDKFFLENRDLAMIAQILVESLDKALEATAYIPPVDPITTAISMVGSSYRISKKVRKGDYWGVGFEILGSVPFAKVLGVLLSEMALGAKGFLFLRINKNLSAAELSAAKATGVAGAAQKELTFVGKIKNEFNQPVNYDQLRKSTRDLITALKETKQPMRTVAKKVALPAYVAGGPAMGGYRDHLLKKKRDREAAILREETEQYERVSHLYAEADQCAQHLSTQVGDDYAKCIAILEQIEAENDMLYAELVEKYGLKPSGASSTPSPK